jgi:hypothetical protein
MTDDEFLRYDADGVPIGDRVVSAGWLLPSHVRLMLADAAGVTVFANGAVINAAPHVQVGITVNGRELEGRPVLLDDDYVVGEAPATAVVAPSRAVLDNFLRLAADPSDAAIVAYAGRYGLLGLRSCDRPSADMVLPNVPWIGEQVAASIGYAPAPGTLREPLRLWRRVLREVRAVYTIAGSLRLNRAVGRAAWAPLRGIIELPLGPNDDVDEPPSLTDPELPGVRVVPWVPVDPTALDGQRQALAAVVGAWLAIGAVRPAIVWGDPGREEPRITLGVTTLFGGLVLELLLAICGQAGFAFCTACGLPYVPRRRLPAGRDPYCPSCHEDGKPQLAAAARWRAKNPRYFGDRRAGAR